MPQKKKKRIGRKSIQRGRKQRKREGWRKEERREGGEIKEKMSRSGKTLGQGFPLAQEATFYNLLYCAGRGTAFLKMEQNFKNE